MLKAKKIWGQHFLKDTEIALRVLDGLSRSVDFSNILEIGPGKGVLTLGSFHLTTYLLTTDTSRADIRSSPDQFQ